MFSTAFLLAASMVVGQAEDVSPHYQHLGELEYFVGTWQINGGLEVKGDFRGLEALENIPLKQVMTYEWLKSKGFLALIIRDTPDSPIAYLGAIGWDPEHKQIRSMDFNTQGAWLKYVHIKKDFGWVMEGTSVYPGGVEGVYRAEIKVIDDNHFRHEGKGTMKENGKESTLTLTFEAKRQ